MAEEEEDDVSEITGSEGDDSGTGGTEGDSEGSGKTAEIPVSPPTELHNAAMFMAKYLDQKLDKLFAATEKINVDIAEMEKRIMTELGAKMEANQVALTMRITGLDNLTADHTKRLGEMDDKAGQQAHQLDELQNQEGAEGGIESQEGTESEQGTESEAGTESEVGTESETTEGETTEEEEEEEVE